MDGKPFFFDENIFDDDNLSTLTQAEKDAMPEFTRDEVEAEKSKARNEGHEAGKQEALQSIQKQSLDILTKIQRDMSVLFAAEHDRLKHYEDDAILLTIRALQQAFPALMKHAGVSELETKIRDVFHTYSTPDNIIIEVNPETRGHIESCIRDIEANFLKTIEICSSPALSAHECKISWPQGGIILNQDQIVEKTASIIIESLAEKGINVHDRENTAENHDSSNIKDQVGDTPHG